MGMGVKMGSGAVTIPLQCHYLDLKVYYINIALLVCNVTIHCLTGSPLSSLILNSGENMFFDFDLFIRMEKRTEVDAKFFI